MDKIYKEHNRFRFLNSIKDRKSKYFIVCLDIIGFSDINDKYGILEGDKLLKELIEFTKYLDENNEYKIESCIYEKDIILVVINSSDENEVIKTINQIILNEYSYKVNFRIGYSKINDPKEVISIIENAQFIIKNKKYEVKHSATNDLNIIDDIERYMKIKEYIIKNKEEFVYLVYQPKVNVNTQKIESCEILSRCRNNELGNVFPSEFLPVIKNLNYQYEFDIFIFESMCKEMIDMKKYIKNFSINFSIHSMSKNDVVDNLLSIVKQYNVKSSDITIEVLEDVCYENEGIVYDNINKLYNHGFNISIDDFGTGYSSYYRLAALKFSEIKIPREFLILENDFYKLQNKNILSAIVEFCKKIECKIVSEGIETKYDDELMKKLGVDYIQGYFYSKPLEKIEFIEFIVNFNSIL